MAYPPNISTNKYGWYMEDPGVGNFVECLNCLHRFVGGTEVSRLTRFILHANDKGHTRGARAVESEQLP